MGSIFNNCPYNWVTDESRYQILLFILCNFQILDDSRKKLFKTLAVSLSFFKILVPSTCVIFSLDIILLGSNGLTIFQKFLLSITYIFYTQLLIIFSFTFSQKCSTQVPLLIIIDFIFLAPIFEKNIPQTCSYHNCFR